MYLRWALVRGWTLTKLSLFLPHIFSIFFPSKIKSRKNTALYITSLHFFRWGEGGGVERLFKIEHL